MAFDITKPPSPENLPSFEQAQDMKVRAENAVALEKAVQAIFFHINKHQLNPLGVATVLGVTYGMVMQQLPDDEARKQFSETFKQLAEKSEPKSIIT